jgi:uncharacterized membrane protein
MARIGSGIAAAIVLTAATARGQDAPAVYAAPEAGVALRATPGGAVIGRIPGGARPLEATAADPGGAWVRIGWGEGEGWVAVDALIATEVARIADTPIPDGLVCAGTEPFWSLRFGADAITYGEPGAGPVALGLLAAEPAQGRRAFPLAITLMSEILSGVAVLRPAACTDGMSGRTDAWTLDFIAQRAATQRLRTGCCRLAPAP